MTTRILTLALVGSAALATGAFAVAPPRARPATGVATSPTASPRTLVYYFHGTARCATCRTIEAYAHETVAGRFAADLEARSLEWRVINVDEPANSHFVRDFQLYTRSVVVVDAKDPKRFKVLDRVWQLVRNKAAFQGYVEQEIRAFPRS
jgi:hypothetical protein